MNIIDWLEDNHNDLRAGLVTIREDLDRPDLRSVVNNFIAELARHERIEEEILFPKFEREMIKHKEHEIPVDFDTMHTKIWALLDRLLDAISRCQFLDLQQSFFEFAAAMEAHFGYEERVLFPVIRQVLGQKTLEELGCKMDQKKADVALRG